MCCLWDLRMATVLCENRAGSPGARVRHGFTACGFTSSGAISIAACDDGAVYGWETLSTAGNRGPAWTLRGHTNRVSCMKVAPNGQALASGSWDNLVMLWC